VAGRSEGSAAAWAAAAVVLAVGALGFGVAAQVRLTHLEQRIDRQQATTRASATSRPLAPPTTFDGTPSTTTTTVVDAAPANDVVARSSVIHAYQTVYDGSAPTDTRLAFIDDPTGVSAAFQMAASGRLATQASAIKARIDSVTFDSAVEASVRYAILVNGIPQFDHRVGTARFDNGLWKVTRATVCGDLLEAGAPCQS
jgi:hypothetical protein